MSKGQRLELEPVKLVGWRIHGFKDEVYQIKTESQQTQATQEAANAQSKAVLCRKNIYWLGCTILNRMFSPGWAWKQFFDLKTCKY